MSEERHDIETDSGLESLHDADLNDAVDRILSVNPLSKTDELIRDTEGRVHLQDYRATLRTILSLGLSNRVRFKPDERQDIEDAISRLNSEITRRDSLERDLAIDTRIIGEKAKQVVAK